MLLLLPPPRFAWFVGDAKLSTLLPLVPAVEALGLSSFPDGSLPLFFFQN